MRARIGVYVIIMHGNGILSCLLKEMERKRGERGRENFMYQSPRSLFSFVQKGGPNNNNFLMCMFFHQTMVGFLSTKYLEKKQINTMKEDDEKDYIYNFVITPSSMPSSPLLKSQCARVPKQNRSGSFINMILHKFVYLSN